MKNIKNKFCELKTESKITSIIFILLGGISVLGSIVGKDNVDDLSYWQYVFDFFNIFGLRNIAI